MPGFQRLASGTVGMMVAALVVVAGINPPSGITRAPAATFPEVPSDLVGRLTVPPVVAQTPAMKDDHGDKLPRQQARDDKAPHSVEWHSYDLDGVGRGVHQVPRLFVTSVPHDLGAVRETGQRKTLFFKMTLPLILKANEEIKQDRLRVWKARFVLRAGGRLAAAERLWLSIISERYGVKNGDTGALLQRIDIVPPSLALAQAASESGWGTSRFVREGNAMFGQWTYKKQSGIVPVGRDAGKTHRVRSFVSLTDSVRAYAHNLNTHRAYKEFRAARAAMRRKGQPLDAGHLAGTLKRYSERGMDYVEEIRTIITANTLRRLDEARLGDADPLI